MFFGVVLWLHCFSAQYLINTFCLEVSADLTLRPYRPLRSGSCHWTEFGKGITKYGVWALHFGRDKCAVKSS